MATLDADDRIYLEALLIPIRETWNYELLTGIAVRTQ